jgi:hypothetical protein
MTNVDLIARITPAHQARKAVVYLHRKRFLAGVLLYA